MPSVAQIAQAALEEVERPRRERRQREAEQARNKANHRQAREEVMARKFLKESTLAKWFPGATWKYGGFEEGMHIWATGTHMDNKDPYMTLGLNPDGAVFFLRGKVWRSRGADHVESWITVPVASPAEIGAEFTSYERARIPPAWA